jgi:hypothetical protein
MKRYFIKRYLRIIVVGFLLILVPIVLFAGDYKYVSSKYSIRYHKPNCKQALKIDPLIRITFNTAKEAIEAGKQPCGLCKPPTKDSFFEGSSGTP